MVKLVGHNQTPAAPAAYVLLSICIMRTRGTAVLAKFHE
jgi:hypothetical protein